MGFLRIGVRLPDGDRLGKRVEDRLKNEKLKYAADLENLEQSSSPGYPKWEKRVTAGYTADHPRKSFTIGRGGRTRAPD